MNKLFSLANKTILITGGYGHLGKGITLGIQTAGGQAVVLGRSHEKFVEAFGENSEIGFVPFDISSTISIKEGFKEIEKRYGKIDVLINNAFYGQGGQSDNISDENWALTLDGTLSSVHKCIREILPYFRKNGGGKIINVSSMYGMIAPDFTVYQDFEKYTNPPNYGAAKAGVIQLTRYFASLLGKENILVNVVSPGPFPSIDVQKNKGFIKNLSFKNPLGRIGHPEELQGIFVFLSSEASNYITGQNISVDGGWTSV